LAVVTANGIGLPPGGVCREKFEMDRPPSFRWIYSGMPAFRGPVSKRWPVTVGAAGESRWNIDMYGLGDLPQSAKQIQLSEVSSFLGFSSATCLCFVSNDEDYMAIVDRWTGKPKAEIIRYGETKHYVLCQEEWHRLDNNDYFYPTTYFAKWFVRKLKEKACES
jgi:hypothetical protein